MTALEQRPSLEDRIRAATRAAAGTVPDDGAPPLQLRAQRRRANRLPASWTGLVGSPGEPWLPRLAAPLAATAAVLVVIAASVAVAGRSHAPTSPAGLAGAPRYYLELTSAYSAGPPGLVTTTSTISSPAATGQVDSPSPTAPATASSPAATGQFDSPSPTAPATTVSPSGTGLTLHTALLAAVLQHAVIRATATGAIVGTIWPPRTLETFVQATGAADDRTFVLTAENIVSSSGVGACGRTALILARFNPVNGKARVTPLRLPDFPATSQVDSIALSPDGTKLAVSLGPGQRCASDGADALTRPGSAKNHETSREEIRVYSLNSGAVKTWESAPQSKSAGQVGPTAMSFARNGMLAFNQPAIDDNAIGSGLWLLNTNAPGGSLLAHSRLVVYAQPEVGVSPGSAPVAGRWNWAGDGILTPDGKTVVAPVLKHPGGRGAALGEFSASTGKLVRVLWQHSVRDTVYFVPDNAVAWTNPSGSVLIVASPAALGKKAARSVYGVLRGHRFTPIPGTQSQGTFTLVNDTVIVF